MIEVRVPATSANLGPGFDTLGLALNLYNSFIFEEIPQGLEISGCEKTYADENNLVYIAMQKTFERLGYIPSGIKIKLKCQIPISRGLGSSASCILGGVIGANELARGLLTSDEILEIATEIEGHPDNLAPALFGGLVVSIMEGGRIYHNKVNISPGIKFIALVPDFTLSTKESRDLLPTSVAHEDAVHNVAKVSLLLSALSNGNFHLLELALQDKLHQPYRSKLIPKYDHIIQKANELGSLGTYLSGAGPTIMAIVEENNDNFSSDIRTYLNSIHLNWDVLELELNLAGIEKTAICL